MERLGLDIGRVIIGPRVDGREDTSFLGRSLEEAMDTPAAQGSFAVIAALVEAHSGAVWLVSKCGPSVQRKTRAWLDHHDFWGKTGMDRSHLEFCRTRKEKTPIARRLGLTAFVDDAVGVLQPMRSVVPDAGLFLFGEQNGPVPGWARHVPDWAAVGRAFGLSQNLSA